MNSLYKQYHDWKNVSQAARSMLAGTGKGMRHVKVFDLCDVDARVLRRLIKQAELSSMARLRDSRER